MTPNAVMAKLVYGRGAGESSCGGRFAAAFGASDVEDRTARSGVEMVLKNGATGAKHQIETMVGGVATFDYDGDGRLDLYFANGAAQPKLGKPDSSYHNKLYRNLGNWQFEDVTSQAGVAGSGFHFGVAAADYDNDGRVDLFVTGMPRSILYRNRGDGTFEDVTEKAGVLNRQQWPVSAGWFDYDNDGRLDLFVVNYVAWNPATEPFCGDSVERKYRTYCHPSIIKVCRIRYFTTTATGRFPMCLPRPVSRSTWEGNGSCVRGLRRRWRFGHPRRK
jgi:hypothetical protein